MRRKSWSRWDAKATVEETPSLNLTRLLRAGAFQAPTTLLDDSLGAEIEVFRDVIAVTPMGQHAAVSETVVDVVWVARNLGGDMPLLLCPRCGVRVRRLYAVDYELLCRVCGNLTHASSSESDVQRAVRRASRLRARFQGSSDVLEPPRGRRKGEWIRTYERRLEVVQRADEALAAAWATTVPRRRP